MIWQGHPNKSYSSEKASFYSYNTDEKKYGAGFVFPRMTWWTQRTYIYACYIPLFFSFSKRDAISIFDGAAWKVSLTVLSFLSFFKKKEIWPAIVPHGGGVSIRFIGPYTKREETPFTISSIVPTPNISLPERSSSPGVPRLRRNTYYPDLLKRVSHYFWGTTFFSFMFGGISILPPFLSSTIFHPRVIWLFPPFSHTQRTPRQ